MEQFGLRAKRIYWQPGQAVEGSSGRGQVPPGAPKHNHPPQQGSLDESWLEERGDALMTMMALGNKAYRDAEIGRYRGRMKELVEELELKRAKSKKGGTKNYESRQGAGQQAGNIQVMEVRQRAPKRRSSNGKKKRAERRRKRKQRSGHLAASAFR